MPQAVSLNYLQTNTQNHINAEGSISNECSRAGKGIDKVVLRIINLTNIHKNLWIGDKNSIGHFISFGSSIINLSNSSNSSNSSKYTTVVIIIDTRLTTKSH